MMGNMTQYLLVLALTIKLLLLSSSYVRLDNKQTAVHRQTLSVPQRGGVWTSAPEGVAPVAASGRFLFFLLFFTASLHRLEPSWPPFKKLFAHDSFDRMKENSSSRDRRGGQCVSGLFLLSLACHSAPRGPSFYGLTLQQKENV